MASSSSTMARRITTPELESSTSGLMASWSTRIPLNATSPAKASQTATLQGNLSANTPAQGSTPNPADSQVQTTVVEYDTLGRSHNIKLTFTRQTPAAGADVWTVGATGDATMTSVTPSVGQITFNDSGNLIQPTAANFLPASIGLQVVYN